MAESWTEDRRAMADSLEEFVMFELIELICCVASRLFVYGCEKKIGVLMGGFR